VQRNKNHQKKPWRWDPIYEQAFDNIKAAIAKEIVLAYSNFLKPFEIYMDASATQLGAVLTQDNRPIVFSAGNYPKRNKNTVSQELSSWS
jgi:hypothetical protein